LRSYGAYTCGDVTQLPIGLLAKRFGNLGRRIWFMCQGADFEPINPHLSTPKSMGHGKILPPNTQDKDTLLTYLMHMAERLTNRLRRHHMQAQYFFIGLRAHNWGWLGEKIKLPYPTHDGKVLFHWCKKILRNYWHGEIIKQVQITALEPGPEHQQLDLFHSSNPERDHLNHIMDVVNTRYGEFTLAPARLLQRSNMNNVIAPAWRPTGERRTI
jgi:DNA polymerase-4